MTTPSFKRIQEIQRLNYEMMDAFRNGLSWILNYCEKNGLPYPDLDQIQNLVRSSGNILNDDQPRGNTDKNQPSSSQNLCAGFCYVLGEILCVLPFGEK